MKWTAEEVKRIQRIAYETDVQSLNTIINGHEEFCDTEMGDLVASDENPFQEFEDSLTRKFLLDLISELDDVRGQQIIRMRYGLDGTDIPKTLEEIGEKYGVTRERIRQIESKALDKLANLIKSKGLKYNDFM